MKPDELDRLLWDDADGALDVAERERLEAALAAEPAGKRRRREVAECASLLAAVEAVPPPPDLRARIDRAIAARPSHRPRPAWRGVWDGVLAPRHRMHLAWAAVLVGAIAAVLLLADGARLHDAGDSRFAGALLPEVVPFAGPETVDLADALGALTLSMRDGSLLCQLRLDRPADGGVRLTVTGGGVMPGAVETAGVSVTPIEPAPDTVGVVAVGVGSASLAVRVAGTRQELSVRVEAAGRVAFARRVGIVGEGQR
jgi:hypothetical protein